MAKEKGQTMMSKKRIQVSITWRPLPEWDRKKYVTNDSIMFLYNFALHKWGLAFYSHLKNTYINALFHEDGRLKTTFTAPLVIEMHVRSL
jgi:hypothetical protein